MSDRADQTLLDELVAIVDPVELERRVRELHAAGHEITLFSCGGPKPVCYRCSSRPVKRCDGPGAEPGTTCGRLLCGEHARGSRCSQHAPETTSATMPRPPRRARDDAGED